jgi:hypothetical protein
LGSSSFLGRVERLYRLDYAGMRVNPISPGPMPPGRTGPGPVVAVVVPLGSPRGAVIVAGLISSPGAALPFLTSSSPPIRPDLVYSPIIIGNFLAVRRTFFRNFGISRQPVRKREDGHPGFGPVTAPGDAEPERLEAEARAEKRGLWSQPNPVPPWS